MVLSCDKNMHVMSGIDGDKYMKTLIVYAHLLAACLAVGILLIQDLAIARGKGNPLSSPDIENLKQSAGIILFALVALWCSGLLLVFMGYQDNPQQYLANQKLWAKFTVVILLTLNGVVLHFYSFPRITSRVGLLGLSTFEQILVALSGVISSVSWLYACYLGIARSWNYTVGYGYVMFIYSIPIILGFIVSCEVLRSFRIKSEPTALEAKRQA
jgi:hypothetical protein